MGGIFVGGIFVGGFFVGGIFVGGIFLEPDLFLSPIVKFIIVHQN